MLNYFFYSLSYRKRNLFLTFFFVFRCNLEIVSKLSLPNLRELYLKDNMIATLDLQDFVMLQNLLVLDLSGNPLETLTSSDLAGGNVCASKEIIIVSVFNM